jgi:hypothetical protein
MTKSEILAAIRRVAADMNGVPPGIGTLRRALAFVVVIGSESIGATGAKQSERRVSHPTP